MVTWLSVTRGVGQKSSVGAPSISALYPVHFDRTSSMPERTRPLEIRKGAVARNTAKTMTIVSTTVPVVRATAGSHRPTDLMASRHLLFLDALMMLQKLSNSCA